MSFVGNMYVNDNKKQRSPLEQSQRNIQNNATRIFSAGGAVPEADSGTHPILKALSYLDRPRNALWNGVQDSFTGENSFGQGFMEGLKGKEEVHGTDLMQYLFGKADSRAGKVAQGIGGFAAEMLLDPLNLVPATGVGKLAKGFTTRAGATLSEDAAKKVIAGNFFRSIDQRADDVYDKVIRTAEARATSRGEKMTVDHLGGWSKKNLRVMAMRSELGDDALQSIYEQATGKQYAGGASIRELNDRQAEHMFNLGKDVYVSRKAADPAELQKVIDMHKAEVDPKGLSIGIGKAKKTLISGGAMQDAGAAAYRALDGSMTALAKSNTPILAPVARLIQGAEKGARKIFDNAYIAGIDPQEYQIAKNIQRWRQGEGNVLQATAQKQWQAYRQVAKQAGLDDATLNDVAQMYYEGGLPKGAIAAQYGDDIANAMDDVRREWLVQAFKKVGAGKMNVHGITEDYMPHKLKIGMGGGVARAFTNDKLAAVSKGMRGRYGGKTIQDFENHLQTRFDLTNSPYSAKESIERDFSNLYLISELETGNILAETKTAEAFRTIFGRECLADLQKAGRDGEMDLYLGMLENQGKVLCITKDALKAIHVENGGRDAMAGLGRMAENAREEAAALGQLGDLGDTIRGMADNVTHLTEEEAAALYRLLGRVRNDEPLIALSRDDYFFVSRFLKEVYEMPEALLNKYISSGKKQAGESIKAFADFIDGFHSMWKGTVAGLRPGFHMGNWLGSNWQNYIDHGLRVLVDPRIQYLAKRAATKTGDWESLVVKEADGSDMIRDGVVVTLGKLAHEMASRHAVSAVLTDTGENVLSDVGHATRGNAVKRGWNKAMQVGRGVGNAVEWDVRTANYIAHLQKGLDWDAAAQATNRVHFDYNDLTDAEMKVFRRLAPFYTWSRKNIPLAIEELINNPRIANVPQRFTENMNEATGQDQQFMPSWAKNNLFVPNIAGYLQDGNNAVMNMKLPMADLTRLHASPVEGMKEGLSMLSPFYKAPMELVFNESMLNGAPITTEDMSGQEQWRARAAYLIKQAGIFGDIGRAGVGLYGKTPENDAPGVMERRSGAYGGLSLVPWNNLGYNYNEQAGELNYSKAYERQLGNVLKTMGNQGIEVPTMADLQRRTPLQKKFDRRMEYMTHGAYQAPISPRLKSLIAQANAAAAQSRQNYY